MSEQGDADALRPAGVRRRSWKRSRKLWGLLGALCCLLGAVALATARVNPFDPRLYDPFGGSGAPTLSPFSYFDMFHGYNEPVSVCAMQHHTPGAWPPGAEGMCSQNDVVLSLSDASHASVTFEMDREVADDGVPATVYLRQHDGHWRSFVTCGGIGGSGSGSCAVPLQSVFQGVSLTLRAGMTYDVGVYVNVDPLVCSYCTPAPTHPALPLSFTIIR